ncbi:hypothetical protein ILP92_16080 [Maribius pontilimi]|uniref:SCP domain-containing protein n=1 Tax=Palleronia pontilimi TaxID=1964209 RepID=A0A934MDT8_9RHOB|nr:CAP domain-containing protein [Palleronia pontilimi]MBJ3764268.1 hypothetical protein [Palleronia pontilimi]
MAQASALELLMLDLVNEERTSRGLDPLRIDNDLNQSAEDHSEWMLDTDTFSHTGVGYSSATDRISDAGYDLEGNWRTAENIGWQSERGDPGLEDDVADIHASLMNSPRHRDNILDPDLEEIGIGIEQGDFTTGRGTFDGVVVTQNFGTTQAEALEDVQVLAVSMESEAGGPDLASGDPVTTDAESDVKPGGFDGDDSLRGSRDDDMISGWAGNDSILGAAGNDILDGEAGLDALLGDNDNANLIGDEGDETLVGESDDLLFAETRREDPNADEGTDTLIAGEGVIVTLDGGPGVDRMVGSDASADQFEFFELSSGNTQDTMNVFENFQSGRDLVDIRGYLGFDFIGDDAFSAAGGGFGIGGFPFAGDVLEIDEDGDGTGDVMIEFVGVGILGDCDFLMA